MGDVGLDVWMVVGVGVLKKYLDERLSKMWIVVLEKFVFESLEVLKNGESKVEESKEGFFDNDEVIIIEEKIDGIFGDDIKKDLFI